MCLVCLVLDEHDPAEAAGAQRLQPVEVVQGGRVLGWKEDHDDQGNHAEGIKRMLKRQRPPEEARREAGTHSGAGKDTSKTQSYFEMLN